MDINYSVPLNLPCDSAGEPLQCALQLVYGDSVAVNFCALDADNARMDLSPATKWELTVDRDRAAGTPHLCVVSPTGFTYDAAGRTLSCRLSARTSEFFSSVDGKSQLLLIAELCGYDSSDARLFRFAWNMTGVMPLDGGQPPASGSSGGDLTAFEVYANATAIAAGTTHADLGYITVAIPAQMTEKFTIRSNWQHADSDVVVDWGDGSQSVLRDGDFESEDLTDWSREEQFEVTTYMSHTYADEGRYTVRIHGRRYFAVAHGRTMANNLMCRCMDRDLPLASCVNNLSAFARNALRMVELCIPTGMDLHSIENVGSAFQLCQNLLRAYGMKRKIKVTRCAAETFYQCPSLLQTDMMLPVCMTDADMGIRKCFSGCASLATPIQKLLPSAGFANRVVDVAELFHGCASLTGTVPAAVLWEDTSKVWLNTSTAFAGASDAIRAQVPVAWGGTNTEIVI